MAVGRLRVIRAIPNPSGLPAILRKSIQKDGGMVTAFEDAVLPALHEWLAELDDVEVLPFGSVVIRHLRLAGESIFDLAPGPLHQRAIATALYELDEDSAFARSRQYPGVSEAIQQTLKELHAWGLNSEQLEELAVGLSPELHRKILDLAKVDRYSRSILSELGRGLHTDHLRHCRGGVYIEDEGIPRKLFVVIGSEVHPERMEWLKWAAESGTEVTVFLDRHATDGKIFPGADRVEQVLGAPDSAVGEGTKLLKRLFAKGTYEGAEIDVRLTSAPDRMAEVEWALRKANELGGTSAIYSRSLEDYAPFLEAASARFGIRISLSRRAPLLTNAFARLTLNLLEWCAGPDVRALSSILRSSYLQLARSAREEVDSALKEAHRSRERQWQELELWAAGHIELLPWIEKVLAWRKETLEQSVDLGDWLERLRQLVHELPWHQSEPGGVRYATARDTRAFTVMHRVLAERASIDRVTSQRVYSLRRFVEVCREGWEAADVSVPTSDDGIPVSSDPNQICGADHVFVLGMLEGVFPRRRSEDPVLTDKERIAISEAANLPIPLPISTDRMVAERDLFYRVCATPNKTLELSYPAADDDRDNIPAFYLEAVKAAIGSESKEATHSYRRSDLVPPPESRLLEADLQLAASLEAEREFALPNDLESEGSRALVQVSGEVSLSPEEIRAVLQCPYQAMMRHRLGIRAPFRRSRWRQLTRLPVAAGLAAQPDPTAARKALDEALYAELDRMYPETTEWERTLLKAGGERLIEDWISREFASREKWGKHQDQTRIGPSFGDAGLRASLRKDLQLKGSVPAVTEIEDGEGNRARIVHLYGTPPPTERGALDDDGEAAFIGAYLMAAFEKGVKPMLEFESPSTDRTLAMVSRGDWRLPTSSDLQLRVFSFEGGDDHESNPEQVFYERVKNLFGLAVRRVIEGEVRPNPGKHCEWCDYGDLCRRSTEFAEDESPFGPDRPLSEEHIEGGR